MNRYLIKQIIKFSILGVILVFATMMVYDKGIADYKSYLENNKDDEKWIRDHINLVEDNKIGSEVLRPDMPNNLEISDSLYKEVIDEEIDKLLIHNYKIDSPLIIYNPYNIDPTTINLYFHTGNSYKFEYYVTTESIGLEENVIYTRMKNINGEDILSNRHFYVLKGFKPGKKNNLLIRILDDNDRVIDAENFILNLPNK